MPRTLLTAQTAFILRSSHRHPTRRALLMVGTVVTLGLAACGSPTSLPVGHDKGVDAAGRDMGQSAAVTGGPPSSLIASPTATSSASAAAPAAIATPIAVPSADITAPRALPADQSSYAGRADAAQLADELARQHELPLPWTRDVIAQARYREVIGRLIMPAANPGAKNWAAYRSRFVEPQRLRSGQRFWQLHAADLQRAEARYGVPAHIVAGVIGVETLYGRDTGRFRVLDALTTLSLDFPKGRSDRSAFFRQELGEFLLMCR